MYSYVTSSPYECPPDETIAYVSTCAGKYFCDGCGVYFEYDKLNTTGNIIQLNMKNVDDTIVVESNPTPNQASCIIVIVSTIIGFLETGASNSYHTVDPVMVIVTRFVFRSIDISMDKSKSDVVANIADPVTVSLCALQTLDINTATSNNTFVEEKAIILLAEN